MATRIVSWGGNEPVTTLPPSLPKTPSMIVSVDSILPERPLTSQNIPRADEPRVKHTSSQMTEPNGTTWTSWTSSMCPWVDATDDSFIRHRKYCFEDGNVAFLVENTLYCVHRYFFSRDSTYFSTRFAQLNTRDHEALPTIISLGDVETRDFDAFLSVLYPESFEETDLSYEEWKSVLRLSTRWSFASLCKRALSCIEPPTPHDRLLLARTYSVNDWVVPALSALCERTTPLTLSEARQMSVEDVVLVSTVREHIRDCAIQVDSAEIPFRVLEVEQFVALGSKIPDHLRVPPHFPKSEALSPVDGRGPHESDGECSAEEEAPGDICVRLGTGRVPTLHVANGERSTQRQKYESKTEYMMNTQYRPDVAQWLAVRLGSATTLESSGVGKDDDSDDGDEVPELLAPEDDDPVNEIGLDPKDIELILTQVKRSRATVVRVLKENEGDLINTIMALSE